jgi:hypothetical protein
MAREIKRKCVVCGEKFGTKYINVKWCSSDCRYEFRMRLKEKQQEKERKENFKKMQDNVESSTDLRAKLQVHINSIVRAIDFEQPCISCGKHTILECGHYFAKSKTVAFSCTFHLWNLHGQCKQCNQHLHANIHYYRKGIERIYGFEIMALIDNLPEMYRNLTWSKDELKTATETAKQIFKSLEKGKIYSTDERIELRKTINDKLNLYVI